MKTQTQNPDAGSFSSLKNAFPDEFRRMVIDDAVRLRLEGNALDLYVERERRMAELEALAEYRGDWTEGEAAEYFALSDMQQALEARRIAA